MMNDSLGVLEGDSEVHLTVNGELVSERVPVRRNLADFLRLDLGLTGTHVGCEHGVCGACASGFCCECDYFERVGHISS